jgi:hypothetical protein
LALITLGALLALASAALALVVQYDREEVGPAKEALRPPYSSPELAFRFSPLRCYWLESGFDGFGSSRSEALAAFRGDVDEANAALATFATLPAPDKVVWVLPGPGSVPSADRKASYPCDWQVHWLHTHFSFGQKEARSVSHTAVMTVFVARADPIPKADPRAGRWVRELDDDSLLVREGASRALAGLGDAALPALREGLGNDPSPEQRRRIARLLDRLKPIHLGRVKLPARLRAVSLDALVSEAEKDWRSGDLARSWLAANRLAEWAEHSEDTLPLLAEALRDQREQVRGLALGAFVRLGKRANGALSRLKAAAQDARSPAVQDAVRKAIQAVGEGADTARAEDPWRENRRLRAAIAEYCAAAAKHP